MHCHVTVTDRLFLYTSISSYSTGVGLLAGDEIRHRLEDGSTFEGKRVAN